MCPLAVTDPPGWMLCCSAVWLSHISYRNYMLFPFCFVCMCILLLLFGLVCFPHNLKVKSWISDPVCLRKEENRNKRKGLQYHWLRWQQEAAPQNQPGTLAGSLCCPRGHSVLCPSVSPHQPFVSEQTKISGIQLQTSPVGKSVSLKGSMFGLSCWQRALWTYSVKVGVRSLL